MGCSSITSNWMASLTFLQLCRKELDVGSLRHKPYRTSRTSSEPGPSAWQFGFQFTTDPIRISILPPLDGLVADCCTAFGCCIFKSAADLRPSGVRQLVHNRRLLLVFRKTNFWSYFKHCIPNHDFLPRPSLLHPSFQGQYYERPRL